MAEDVKAEAAEVLPDVVSETDLLRIEVGQERQTRLIAQRDAAQLQLNDINRQIDEGQKNLTKLVNELSVKYKVKGEDTYDRTTGKITRK